MTASHETTPYGGDPDEFDLIAGELLEYMEDPYITRIHEEARLYQDMLQDPADDNEFIRREILYDLNSKWHYGGQDIEIVGMASLKETEDAEVTRRMHNGEKLESIGFTFYDAPTDVEGVTKPQIGHYFMTDTSDGLAKTYAFFALDDIKQFILPVPSLEGRERRFLDYHEEKAQWIDDQVENAPRDDQILSSFRGFHIDVDMGKKEDVETLRDATVYMRNRANIEPIANYRLSMLGDVIFIDERGNGIPRRIKQTYTKPVHIRRLMLRPAEVSATNVNGKRSYVPFIDVVAFRETGDDIEMLVPCSSISMIHSMRYNGAP